MRLRPTFIRRLIQFRLQTLLAVIAIASLWLSAEWKAVHERRAAFGVSVIGVWADDDSRISWVRRAMGDRAWKHLTVLDVTDLNDLETPLIRAKKLFPDASRVDYGCAQVLYEVLRQCETAESTVPISK